MYKVYYMHMQTCGCIHAYAKFVYDNMMYTKLILLLLLVYSLALVHLFPKTPCHVLRISVLFFTPK